MEYLLRLYLILYIVIYTTIFLGIFIFIIYIVTKGFKDLFKNKKDKNDYN